MLTVDEIKSDIARLEKRLLRERQQCRNTELAITGAKIALKTMDGEKK